MFISSQKFKRVLMVAVVVLCFATSALAQFSGKLSTIATDQRILLDPQRSTYAVAVASKTIGVFWMTNDNRLLFARVNKKGKRVGAVRTIAEKVFVVDAVWANSQGNRI